MTEALPSGEPHRADASSRTDCSEVFLRVFEYIDHEMTDDDGVRMRAHLDECARCLAEYHRDVLLKSMVRRSCGHESAPATLRMAIMARITTVSIESTD